MTLFNIFWAIIFGISLFLPHKGLSLNISLRTSKYLKALMPLLIVICHNIPGDLGYSGAACVSMFFMISSYGMSVKANSNSLTFKYISGRIIKILLPLVFCIILFQITKFITVGHIYPRSTFSNFVLYGDTQLLLPFSWFPITLAMFYSLTYFCTRLKSKVCSCLALLIGTITYCAIMRYVNFGGYWYNTCSFFVIGYIVAIINCVANENISAAFSGENTKWGQILSFIAIVCANIIANKVEYCVSSVILVSFIQLCAIWLICETTDISRIISTRLFRFLSTYSYWFYLCSGISLLIIADEKFLGGSFDEYVHNTNLAVLIIKQYGITILFAIAAKFIYDLFFGRVLKRVNA